jgi:hypothetical protein
MVDAKRGSIIDTIDGMEGGNLGAPTLATNLDSSHSHLDLVESTTKDKVKPPPMKLGMKSL